MGVKIMGVWDKPLLTGQNELSCTFTHPIFKNKFYWMGDIWYFQSSLVMEFKRSLNWWEHPFNWLESWFIRNLIGKELSSQATWVLKK